MTNPFTESATDDVLYPDDLSGKKLLLRGEEPVDADEVPHDDAKYGYFTKCENSEGTEVWISSPKALREWIGENYAEVRNGTPFEIMTIDKPSGENEPYVIDVRLIEDGDSL